jgi:transcriptional regulator with XRE-family HTH domain
MTDFTEVVRRYMTERGTTLRALARAAPCDPSHLSRVLNGKQPPSRQLAAALDAALGAGGEVTAAATAAQAPGITVPLLLSGDIGPAEQLLAFLRSVSESDNLFGPRRLIGVVREHIDLIAELRKDATGADGRQLTGIQGRYAETLAWLYQDSADWREARYWLDRALEWAFMSGDTRQAAFALARKSQLAGDMRDPVAAVDLADAAARLGGGGRLLAAGASYQAYGHALAGRETDALRVLDAAREIAAGPADAPEAPWTPWLDTGYVDLHRARCLTVLGAPGQAVPLFEQAISQAPAQLRRDRGVYTARQAVAQALSGDTAAAAGSGMTALSVMRLTGSGRISAELRDLDAALKSQKGDPAAVAFRRAFASARS